ncbi:MAG: alcohol dehydrogenase, partial [Rhodobacteraceae bacterium]
INSLSRYLNINNGFDGFLSFVKNLNKALNIPINLSEIGVLEGDIDRIVEGALKDPSKNGNPVKLNAKNLKKLLISAI